MMRTLLLMLLLSVPAFAQDEAPEEAPAEGEGEGDPMVDDGALLIWGPSSAVGLDDVATSGLSERLETNQAFPGRVLRVADWLGAAKFRLGGSAVPIPCAAPPADIGESDKTEIVALNEMARKQIDDLNFAGGLELYEEAMARLPCQLVFVDPAAAWDTYFYAGIAAFYVEQRKKALEYFKQAATIDPARQWDSSFPPDPQSTYLKAVQDVIARPMGRVFGDMRGTQYIEVRLDGESLDLTKAFETTVRPGQHLIQAVDDRGDWTTWVRQVEEGATLTFFSAKGAEQMLLDGPDGVLKNLAAADLTRRGEEEKLTDIFLVTIDPAKKTTTRVFRYQPDFQLWSRLEKGQQAVTESARPTDGGAGATNASNEGERVEEMTPEEKRKFTFLREADYRSSAHVGFKYASIWRCGAATADANGRCADGYPQQNNYIGGLVGIDVRLYKGLNLDFGFGALVSDINEGGTILPEARGGLRYRFLTGAVQPFVAAAADVFFGTFKPNQFEESKLTVYAGPSGYGGVDFELGDGFRLSVEGGFTMLLTGEGRNSEIRWPAAHAMVSLGRMMP
jgi:tetratricopeptide (TPR) repeat protein